MFYKPITLKDKKVKNIKFQKNIFINVLKMGSRTQAVYPSKVSFFTKAFIMTFYCIFEAKL